MRNQATILVLGCFFVFSFFAFSVEAKNGAKNDNLNVMSGLLRQANPISNQKHRQQLRDTQEATCWNGMTSPGPNTLLEGHACCWYSDSTCCVESPSYSISDMLNGIENNLTFILEHAFNSTSNQCYLNLADLACSMCAPNNLYFSITGPTFTLCSSWCDQIWDSCKPYTDSLQIPTIFNSTQFCQLLFSELDEDTLKIDDTACFGGYPIKDIECTGCIPGTTPCGGAGWKVAVIVILVIAGVAALAALSVFLFRRYKNRQSGEASFGRGGKFTSFADEDE